MSSLHVAATLENLDQVLGYVEENLNKINCPQEERIQISIAVEELFVNVASYAYNPEVGEAQIICEVEDSPATVTITLLDGGKPYNPLLRADPDVTLSAEERGIGGLGIFMVKQSMDYVDYEYVDGKNKIKIHKRISE